MPTDTPDTDRAARAARANDAEGLAMRCEVDDVSRSELIEIEAMLREYAATLREPQPDVARAVEARNLYMSGYAAGWTARESSEKHIYPIGGYRPREAYEEYSALRPPTSEPREPERELPRVVYATVRESGDDDWWDIECRFDNGEKWAPVQVDRGMPTLAHFIADSLSATPPRQPSVAGGERERIKALVAEIRAVYDAAYTAGGFAAQNSPLAPKAEAKAQTALFELLGGIDGRVVVALRRPTVEPSEVDAGGERELEELLRKAATWLLPPVSDTDAKVSIQQARILVRHAINLLARPTVEPVAGEPSPCPVVMPEGSPHKPDCPGCRGTGYDIRRPSTVDGEPAALERCAARLRRIISNIDVHNLSDQAVYDISIAIECVERAARRPTVEPVAGGPRLIHVRPSPTADTRTCDFANVSKATLYASSVQHIEDVRSGLAFFRGLLETAANNHDPDKLTDIDGFHADFVTGFKQTGWLDRHRKLNRHHLTQADGVPEDVNLVDVLDFIADWVMAGMARSGSVYALELPPELLERAFQNTVELLKAQVVLTPDSAVPSPAEPEHEPDTAETIGRYIAAAPAVEDGTMTTEDLEMGWDAERASGVDRLATSNDGGTPSTGPGAAVEDGQEPKVHQLKTWPAPFRAVLDGRKPFEWRKNDRHFRVGDTLVLNEWHPDANAYTGLSCRRVVTYLLEGRFGIPDGYCVLGIAPESGAAVEDEDVRKLIQRAVTLRGIAARVQGRMDAGDHYPEDASDNAYAEAEAAEKAATAVAARLLADRDRARAESAENLAAWNAAEAHAAELGRLYSGAMAAGVESEARVADLEKALADECSRTQQLRRDLKQASDLCEYWKAQCRPTQQEPEDG